MTSIKLQNTKKKKKKSKKNRSTSLRVWYTWWILFCVKYSRLLEIYLKKTCESY